MGELSIQEIYQDKKAEEIIYQFKCYRHVDDGLKKYSEVDIPAMKKWASISVLNTIQTLKYFKENIKDLSVAESVNLTISLEIKLLKMINKKILNYDRHKNT